MSAARASAPARLLAAAALLCAVLGTIVGASGPAGAQVDPASRAPSNLAAEALTCGVRLTWDAPATDASTVTDYRVLRSIPGESLAMLADTGSTNTGYTDLTAEQGATYIYAVQALRGSTASAESDTATLAVPARPTPSAVAVDAVPIVVSSTTDDYFVLYLTHQVSGVDQEMPVALVRGEAGTTTLAENVAALPGDRYRVEKYAIADPADIDGDCIDDITELSDPTGMNPLNPTGEAIPIALGAAAIPDRTTFEQIANEFRGVWAVKFVMIRMDTAQPAIYFSNTTTRPLHRDILRALGVTWTDAGLIRGAITYSLPPDGSETFYRFAMKPGSERVDTLDDLELVERVHALLAASMPVLDDDLAYSIQNDWLSELQPALESYRASRVPLVFYDDLFAGASFIALNPGEGYGLLRVMDPDDRPGPRDVVLYESLPNDLPRVAGVLSTVPQTPLSHVNLRAAQDNIPNAFIRDALSNPAISDLLDRHVYYKVTEETWQMRAATIDEVNAHYDSSRPAEPQRLRRILSETSIQPLSDLGFDACEAYGVKAANLAVLGTLGFPAGTVPEGFAIPFYFYDEFMKQPLGDETLFGKRSAPDEEKIILPADTRLIEAVAAILAHPKFQADLDIQDEMLDDLRDAIEDAESPQWIIDALTAMHDTYPVGQSLRYRSSTNNEDLPGFNGAGLYDSSTQNPDETEEDGIDKSLKQVYASLWNYRAFAERDFNRVDHRTVAMGVLVHPNFKDELVNGVAVSVDPSYGFLGSHYVNSQVGEDLVTNPEEDSVPEEVLLHDDGSYTVITTSNLVPAGELLMTDAQLSQLRGHLEEIHAHFHSLYDPAPGEPFAMEIEFKITSANVLAIKQARPWIFSRPPSPIEGGQGDRVLTASLEDPPTAHDGTRFGLRIRFSTPISISFAEFLENAFQVTGATVTTADRGTGDGLWEFTFRPDGNGNVTIALIPNRPCTLRGAVCTADGVPLSNRIELVVRGPDGGSGTDEPVESVRTPCTGPNGAPQPSDDLLNAIEDEASTFYVLVNDADPNSHALMLADITSPANGKVTITLDNTVVYMPDENFNGADSFTYTATDGELFATATASITVSPQNDPPQFPAGPITREVPFPAVGGDRVGAPVVAVDVDSASLSYGLSSTEFEIHPQTGQIVVAPDVTFDPLTTSSYVVTVFADDEHGGRGSAEVTINVFERLSIPVIGGLGGGGGPTGPEPSDQDFEWTVARDIEELDPAHDTPSGAWSDGDTLWLLHNASGSGDAVYAYDLASGERAPERDFPLHETNRAPRGIWSDGMTAWVSDSGQERLFAYDLESGERVPEREIALAPRNRDARGIWAGGGTMWVADGGKEALFAYDLESGLLLAEYALAPENDDPHGLWSDGTTVWVSNHDPKRLFAYRLPRSPAGDAGAGGLALERVRDEDFTRLSAASNNSPRGIWSDGGVMYVADESDGRVYTYNMPDAQDARLLSLSLEGVDIGSFSPLREEYSASLDPGVRATTVGAEAAQPGAAVDVSPPDSDAEREGHQVALAGAGEITVTVTSEDGSRERLYRVVLPGAEESPAPCLRGAVAVGLSLVVSEGGSVEELLACAEGRHVTALYTLAGGEFLAYILGAPESVNRAFTELYAEGVPAGTPLVVRSDGPATEAPTAAAPPGGGPAPPACLSGELARGLSLAVYEGGAVSDLASCAEGRHVTALYALAGGEFLAYILGAPEFVTRAFTELYASGVPPMTPLIVRADPPGAPGGDGAAGS